MTPERHRDIDHPDYRRADRPEPAGERVALTGAQGAGFRLPDRPLQGVAARVVDAPAAIHSEPVEGVAAGARRGRPGQQAAGQQDQ